MDRLGGIAAAREWSSPEEAARAMGDLAITSVLLDAGAGPRWEYHEAATGQKIGRSEGLGLASLGMFVAGAFSAVPADPLRADAEALESLTAEEFAAGFQITDDNPLEGADGRRALLVSLAEALRASPDLFASEDDPRPGGIIDALAAEAGGAPLPAAAILDFVLEGLSPIWPSRLTLAGIPLGDTWAHPALGDGTPGSDLVPFHKLSTWLSLSLIEPLLVHGVDRHRPRRAPRPRRVPQRRPVRGRRRAPAARPEGRRDAAQGGRAADRGMARSHRHAPVADRASGARPARRQRSGPAARRDPGRRHLARRPPACCGKACGQEPADPHHQRRYGILGPSRAAILLEAGSAARHSEAMER